MLTKDVEYRVHITCPACYKLQMFVQDEVTGILYPIAPYCCKVMEYEDSQEWNAELDHILNTSLTYFSLSQ